MSTDRGQQGHQEVEQHVDIEHRDIDDPAAAWAPGAGDTEPLPAGPGEGVQTGRPVPSEGLYHEVHYGGVATSEAPDGYAPLTEYEPLEDEDWMAVQAPRGVRLRIPTLVLLALLVAAGAFWGGAVAQRHQGSTSTVSALASRLRAGGFPFGGAGGAGAGAGGFGGATTVAPAAEGTVTDVQGTTVYLTNAAGNLVKVIIGPTTTVSRTGIGAPGALQIGDTAIVRGTAGSDGTVAATSITATASGVSATAGTGAGLAGGTGFGGGAGAGG